MSIYSIIKSLEDTSSRLEKEDILFKNKDNEELKQFFYLALEPKANFYIKKIPPYNTTENSNFILAMDSLAFLSSRYFTGHAGIEHLKKVFSMCSKEDAQMIERIIKKNPKCGVSTSTVNKIWKDLITDVPYMRASLIKDSYYSKIDWSKGVYSQEKMDGSFLCLSVSVYGDVLMQTRNGTPYPNDQFKEIHDLALYTQVHGSQLHGELLIKKDGKYLPREKSNGILNSILQGDSIPEGHQAVFVVWDIVKNSFAIPKGKYRVPYKDRFDILSEKFQANDAPIILVDNSIVYSEAEAMAHYSEKLAAGLEGTVIKTPDMIWEDTTSKKMIKMKLDCSVDLLLVGFNDADDTSKNRHLFGSMRLQTSDGLLEVNATGFTDKEREEINSMKDDLIGKIVEVTSNNLMKPSKEGGKYSLFLPRFTSIRQDKTEADSLERVIAQFESAVKP